MQLPWTESWVQSKVWGAGATFMLKAPRVDTVKREALRTVQAQRAQQVAHPDMY